MLGFGSHRVDTPLSEPLPLTSHKPHRSSVPVAAPKLEIGSLDAGVKVAAIESASPVSTVTVAFEGGSAYESDAQLGVSRVLEAMAFKSTRNRSTFRLTRELEKIGATAVAKVGRDSIAYSVSAVKLHVPEVVEMLLDSVMNPKLHFWEVSEALQAAQAALKHAQAVPANVITDVLHRAAFDGGLGQPLLLDPSLLNGISNTTVHDFAASLIHPSKAVLAAVGTNLGEVTALANPLVSSEDAAAPAANASSNSTYVGGSLNVVATSPVTYVALGFESKGGLSDPKAAAAAGVVKALLDEGRAVLPRTSRESDVFMSATSFAHLYKNTGLVGILASSAPAQAAQLVDAVSKKVESVAKGVSDAQLKQAKQLAIGAYKASLATSSGLATTLGPQLLLAGKFNPADYVSSVEGLTGADVAKYVSAALKNSPTFVTYGSLSARVPRFETVAKRFA